VSRTISIELPEHVEAQLEAISTAKGIPESELITGAVERYVSVQRFYEARGEIMRHLAERGIHLTDEDVFEAVS
jgi:predicted transcriptional regulator